MVTLVQRHVFNVIVGVDEDACRDERRQQDHRGRQRVPDEDDAVFSEFSDIVGDRSVHGQEPEDGREAQDEERDGYVKDHLELRMPPEQDRERAHQKRDRDRKNDDVAEKEIGQLRRKHIGCPTEYLCQDHPFILPRASVSVVPNSLSM